MLRNWPLFLLAVALTGCVSRKIQQGGTPGVATSATGIYVAPFHNATPSPSAGRALTEITATSLLSRGLPVVQSEAANNRAYRSIEDEGQANMLDIARSVSASHALMGTVHEYRFKSDLDGAPTVGVTMRLVEVVSGLTVWQATGSRSGNYYGSLSQTAQTTIDQMVAEMSGQTTTRRSTRTARSQRTSSRNTVPASNPPPPALPDRPLILDPLPSYDPPAIQTPAPAEPVRRVIYLPESGLSNSSIAPPPTTTTSQMPVSTPPPTTSAQPSEVPPSYYDRTRVQKRGFFSRMFGRGARTNTNSRSVRTAPNRTTAGPAAKGSQKNPWVEQIQRRNSYPAFPTTPILHEDTTQSPPAPTSYPPPATTYNQPLPSQPAPPGRSHYDPIYTPGSTTPAADPSPTAAAQDNGAWQPSSN